MSWAFDAAVVTALLCCSAFFSGAETALFALRPSELWHYARSNSALERFAAELLKRPRRVLLTLLLGNQIVNIAIFSYTVGLGQRLEAALAWPHLAFGVGLATLVLVLVLGEIVPKSVALAAPRLLAPLVAYPVGILGRVVAPIEAPLLALVALVGAPFTRRSGPRRGAITDDELKLLMTLTQGGGEIDADQRSLLQDIIDLKQIRVREAMVPRVEIPAFDLAQDRAAFLELLRRCGRDRLPAYDGDIDHLAWVVRAKDVWLDPERPIRAVAKRVPLIPETRSLESLLKEFREQGVSSAIVIDEYGGTQGWVTTEDIISRLVGELDREKQDRGRGVQELGPDRYRLDGSLGIRQWNELFAMAVMDQRFETVGGLVLLLLGRFPAEGETVDFQNLRFTVEKVRARRIEQVLLEVRREEMDAPGGAQAASS